MAATIRTIKIEPKQPNEYPKHPYLGSAPAGSGLDIRAAIRPISGVNSTDMIKVQPKPILRRLPKSPTNTSSNRWPDNNPKVKIENILLFCNSAFLIFNF